MELAQRIQSRLEQFEWEALFLDDLNWQFQPGYWDRTGWPCQQIQVLATLGTAIVVRVDATQPWRWTPALRHRLWQSMVAKGRDPLLLFVDASRTRCLVYWGRWTTAGAETFWHLTCRGQRQRDWANRLARLEARGLREPIADCLTPLSLLPDAKSAAQFQDCLTALTSAIHGFPTVADRRHYALLILGRLVGLHGLQQKGFLDGGDLWYLQNKFGQSQQQETDGFFRDFLQPLWFQGLILPASERPRPVQGLIGEVPFVAASLFRPHPLDEQFSTLQIADTGFEPLLHWLGDRATRVGNAPMVPDLAPLFEAWINAGTVPQTTPEPLLRQICDRPIHRLVWQRINALGKSTPSLEDSLMGLSATSAAALLAELSTLTLLDPACGSGRYLGRSLDCLAEIYHALLGIAPGQGAEWLAVSPYPHNPELTIRRQILNCTLSGVDSSRDAVELARLQLFLGLVDYLQQADECPHLPDVSLNVMQGNGLIGLVEVEAERFETVSSRGEAEAALQGNLLQPLVADNYLSILSERQIRLEHYRGQTNLLAEVDGVPAYVQAEFLRDLIKTFNQTAQHRLGQLLLTEFSQQLGIPVRERDDEGRLQRRPLTHADLDALLPFHWGFLFDQILRERGGFDLILSHLPGGTVQPTVAEFLTQWEDLFEQKGMPPTSFRHNRQQLLNIDPDLNAAWRQYRASYSPLVDYFRKSPTYAVASQPPPGQTQVRLYWSRLFLERCLQLLRPGGMVSLLLPEKFWSQANAEVMIAWLQSQTQIWTALEVSNQGGVWADEPTKETVSLVQGIRQPPESAAPSPLAEDGSAAAVPPPYLDWTDKDIAPSAAQLGALLQSLIDLAE